MKERIPYGEYFYEKGSKDTEALENNAFKYPYSSLASFLLLFHYKKILHPDFEKLAKKTALLFNNTNWLQFQLDGHGAHEEGLVTIATAALPVEHSHISSGPPELQPEYHPFVNFSEAEAQEVMIEKEEYMESVAPIPAVNETTMKIEVPATAEENIPSQKEEFSDPGSPPAPPPKEVTVENENYPDEEEIPVFEPLHTVDYFASQGIRITEELISNDKLGSQMKSFTQWLRSMKKLHPSKLAEQNLATEAIIQRAAEESNINTEVLTEAMAEVLIKQDKKDKAIEMFNKLSLINPAKSAYFAARIESIKSS